MKRLSPKWARTLCGFVLSYVLLVAASAAGQLAVNPVNMSFGSISIGTNASYPMSLSNTGNRELTISQATKSGTSFTVVTPAMPFTLAPGQNMVITVTFAPQSSGAATGSVSFVYISAKNNGNGNGRQNNSAAQGYFTGVGTTPGLAESPVITSALSTSGAVGSAFSYQITASNSPTSYAATGLPMGLAVNSGTGQILGTPAMSGTSSITVGATNAAGTGSATLGLSVASTNYSVALSWMASPSPDAAGNTITGYNIFRSTANAGPYTQLNPILIAGTTYADTTVADGTTYYYVITAVDSSNAQSGYSNQAEVVIP